MDRCQYSIEGIPVIIRFKTTTSTSAFKSIHKSIEGIPVIIRFKTPELEPYFVRFNFCIEGIPVIIRFKTDIVYSTNTSTPQY